MALALVTSLAAWASGCAPGGKDSPSTAIRLLSPPVGPSSGEPSLAAIDGRVAVGWIDHDPSGTPSFRLSVFREGAWSPPRLVVSDPRLLVNWADPPALAWLHDGGLAADWILRQGAAGTRVYAAVSRDDGVTWTAPQSPHRDTLPSEHGLPALLAASGGGFEIVWLDGRAGAAASDGSGATRLYHASWNAGAFGEEALLDERVCDCCKLALTRAASGTLLAYRDRSEAEVRDISVVRAEGASWSAPALLHADGWTIKACPTNGPSIAASGPSVAVAWFTVGAGSPRVLAARSEDDGRTFSAPVIVAEGGATIGRVDLALLDDGRAVVVWLERAADGASALVARTLAATGAMGTPILVGHAPAGRAGGFPRVASPDGNEIVVAWTAAGPSPAVRVAAWRPAR